MIVALWALWTQSGRARWLLLILGVIVADVLIGSTLLAWELRTFKEMLR